VLRILSSWFDNPKFGVNRIQTNAGAMTVVEQTTDMSQTTHNTKSVRDQNNAWRRRHHHHLKIAVETSHCCECQTKSRYYQSALPPSSQQLYAFELLAIGFPLLSQTITRQHTISAAAAAHTTASSLFLPHPKSTHSAKQHSHLVQQSKYVKPSDDSIIILLLQCYKLNIPR